MRTTRFGQAADRPAGGMVEQANHFPAMPPIRGAARPDAAAPGGNGS
jgi:hypothetical protein